MMADRKLLRRLASLWKPLVLIVFMTTIVGNMLVHLLVQKGYIREIEERYTVHKQTMLDIRQHILDNLIGQTVLPGSAPLTHEAITETLVGAFRDSSDLLRLSLLNDNGSILWGREHEKMVTFFGATSFRAPHGSLLPTYRPSIGSPFPPELSVVQLPIWVNRQYIGTVRGIFWMDVSQTIYMKVDTMVLYITLAAIGGMIVFGIFSTVSRFSWHLSWKQQQVEEYAVSLEQAKEQLRRTRKELYISEKLASLGYLAAGIAHEIGNPLAAVLGYIELLRKGRLDRQKTADILQRTQQEVERIRRILEELVNFSRPHSLHIQYTDVNQVLRRMVSQLPPVQDKPIDITLQLTKFPLFANVDGKKLQSACLNVLGNAIDAIETAGDIRIITSRRIRESTTMPGGSEVIAIQFSDSGAGIASDMLLKIFDPFFTTKEPGKGMGLGLSLCHRIIETFHGEIEVESVPGQGSDITIFLPPAHKKPDNAGECQHTENEAKHERT